MRNANFLPKDVPQKHLGQSKTTIQEPRKELLELLFKASRKRACKQCMYFKKACTHAGDQGQALTAQIMPKFAVETFTDCPNFKDEFESRCRLYALFAWRDPDMHMLSPSAYGICFDKAVYEELVMRVGYDVEFRGTQVCFHASLERHPRVHDNKVYVHMPALGQWLMTHYAMPFPDECPLDVLMEHNPQNTHLDIVIGHSWLPDDEIKRLISNSYARYGQELADAGMDEIAIVYYDLALRYCETSEFALTRKGYTLGNLGRIDEAITCFSRAIEIAKFYPEPWIGIVELKSVGSRADAGAWFDNGIRQNPDDPGWRFGKACWNLHIEDYEKAVINFDRMLEMQQNCVKADEMRIEAIRKIQPTLSVCHPSVTWLKERHRKAGTYVHPSVFKDEKNGRVVGIELIYFVRNAEFPKHARQVRVWAESGLDVWVPITSQFWAGRAVLRHPEIAKWLEENGLVDAPKYSCRLLSLRIEDSYNYELCVTSRIARLS